MIRELQDELKIAVISYLKNTYGELTGHAIAKIAFSFFDGKFSDAEYDAITDTISYNELQTKLSRINEKESIRKEKGVYYTPEDLVDYILKQSITTYLNLPNTSLYDFNTKHNNRIIIDMTVFDPTCGAGEFLLAALNCKFDCLDNSGEQITKQKLDSILKTVNGNDINPDSTAISKLRLFFCTLERYSYKLVNGLEQTINTLFSCEDFVCAKEGLRKYDLIVGNPPYVEDSKYNGSLDNRFGNIYANVLANSVRLLTENGVIGFVIPLSYVSTVRMKKIRAILHDILSQQSIFCFADRPDCLFTSVHQKLCIVVGKKSDEKKKIITSNYTYWYKEQRSELFDSVQAISNDYYCTEYIPKLGTEEDVNIYRKVTGCFGGKPIAEWLVSVNKDNTECNSIYLNMRATFWVKAFMNQHKGAEYKQMHFASKNDAAFIMCLLNSSLFWWFWVAVSDCWHITNKELRTFVIPPCDNLDRFVELSEKLEKQLEQTKKYVGTKQTEYEYKHKECVEIIHQIDDEISMLFGLTDNECKYIKEFAYEYRVAKGVN